MKKVLIADDEFALRMLVAGTLEIGDFEVFETDNGIDAYSLLQQVRPELAILDVMMPGLTGYEVCRKVKTNPELKETKVLILTAKGQQADKEMADAVQADYYLAKPFSPAELFTLVEDILEV